MNRERTRAGDFDKIPEMAVKNLADAIRNVKENTSTEKLTQAYYDQIGR